MKAVASCQTFSHAHSWMINCFANVVVQDSIMCIILGLNYNRLVPLVFGVW